MFFDVFQAPINFFVKVTWFFKPIGADSYWETVKAFPAQEHVTAYEKYARYSVSERQNIIDGRFSKYPLKIYFKHTFASSSIFSDFRHENRISIRDTSFAEKSKLNEHIA